MSPTSPARSRTITAITVAFLLGALVAGLSSSGGGRPVRPTPSDRPDVGVALGGGIFAVDPDQVAGDLEALVEAGVTWVRIDVDWSVAEPGPGLYRWQDADRLLGQADEAGLQILAMVGYTPEWNRPEGTSNKYPPLDLDRFAAFGTAAAERYGAVVDAWEIWNEPNLQGFWESGPDPSAYAELFAAGASGLEDGGVTTPLLSAGLAPSDDVLPVGISPESFLTIFFDDLPPGIAPDAVAIHPYSWPARPAGGQSWNLFSRLPSIHELVVAELGEGVPLWLTEFGAPTADAERAVGEADQAEILVEAIECVAHWDWAANVFVFTLRDSPEDPDQEIEARFGLLRGDGSPKPAYDALVERLVQPFDVAVSPCA